MHICISKLTNSGSDNGLLPGRCEAIIWTNDGLLLTWALAINFSEILSEMQTFSFNHSRKFIWTCRLQNGASLSQPQCVKKITGTKHVTSHYLNQWWPSSQKDTTPAQCVKKWVPHTVAFFRKFVKLWKYTCELDLNSCFFHRKLQTWLYIQQAIGDFSCQVYVTTV